MFKLTDLNKESSLFVEDDNSDAQGNVIIAAGPIVRQGEGTVPFRVIVRRMANNEFVVHDQYFDKTVHLANGGYYSDENNSGAALAMAMYEFSKRIKRLMNHLGWPK